MLALRIACLLFVQGSAVSVAEKLPAFAGKCRGVLWVEKHGATATRVSKVDNRKSPDVPPSS